MGAAANRIKNLADGLINKSNHVEVVCPLPNYPTGEVLKNYRNKIVVAESIDSGAVNRFWIFPSNSKNTLIRLLSMASFALSIWLYP